MHAHRIGERGKREVGSTADGKLAVGSIVVHVTFPGMTKAPLIFVRGHILCFGKISRAGIERSVQITNLNPNPVRYAVMVVAVVVIRS